MIALKLTLYQHPQSPPPIASKSSTPHKVHSAKAKAKKREKYHIEVSPDDLTSEKRTLLHLLPSQIQVFSYRD